MLKTDFIAHLFCIEHFALAVIAVRLQVGRLLESMMIVGGVGWGGVGWVRHSRWTDCGLRVVSLRLLQRKHMHCQVIWYTEWAGCMSSHTQLHWYKGAGRCAHWRPRVAAFAKEDATTVASSTCKHRPTDLQRFRKAAVADSHFKRSHMI